MHQGNDPSTHADAASRASLVQALADAYAEGRAPGGSRLPRESADPEVVDLGSRLRDEVLHAFKDKHESAGERVLFCLPYPPRASWWYGALSDALRHVGIPCTGVTHDDPALGLKAEMFRPTLVLVADPGAYHDSPVARALAGLRRSSRCLILLNPAPPARSDDGLLSAPDRERLEADLSGVSIDGHFSLFAAEWHAERFAEWEAAGFPYLEVPLAFDPLVHHPVAAEKDLDYFMVASLEPHRPATAHEYLAPLMRRFFGLWAGPGWPFGAGRLAQEDTPGYYARARIAPNPLRPGLVAHPADLTQRTFAATACGAFVLTLKTPITERFFAADELIAVEGAPAFGAAFDHFVSRPAERNAVVARGLRRVFAEHTYFHRIDALVRFARRRVGDL